MLEFGSRTSLPARYRIVLAISVALLAHALIAAMIQTLVQQPARATQNLNFILVKAGSDQSQPSEFSKPAPAASSTTSPQLKEKKPAVVASENTIKTPELLPAPQPVVEQPSQTTSAPSPEAAPTRPAPEGSPTPIDGSDRTPITQIATQSVPKDPYVATLERQIAVEISRWPVRSSHSLERLVTMEMEVHLLASGVVRRVDVTRSTGIEPLDESAVKATLRASPYPEPPEDNRQNGMRYRVEVRFSPERI